MSDTRYVSLFLEQQPSIEFGGKAIYMKPASIILVLQWG